MSSFQHSRVNAMDRAAKKCIKTSLKIANSFMFFTGIAILMYSVWMIVFCLRNYPQYHFPWFLWTCIGTGIMFIVIACIGHAGAALRNKLLLTLYVVFLFLLILLESLVTADIFLNDDWDKDFPEDPTKRFDDFVDFVKANSDNFTCLAWLIAISQAVSFSLAMILRTNSHHRAYEDEEVVSATLPFLTHQIQHSGPPYAVGHPDPNYYTTAPYAHHGYYADTAGNEKGAYVTNVAPYVHGNTTNILGNEKGEYVLASAAPYANAAADVARNEKGEYGPAGTQAYPKVDN